MPYNVGGNVYKLIVHIAYFLGQSVDDGYTRNKRRKKDPKTEGRPGIGGRREGSRNERFRAEPAMTMEENWTKKKFNLTVRNYDMCNWIRSYPRGKGETVSHNMRSFKNPVC